ncbi:M24 family metallopeptidase [Oceanobacillus jeddahense]|uniref:Xaa-Pro peptidase family protein n=1 Tax=Oceanobacillus jeddahense TaxID=1462527 RepID=A0ABY5JT01_9BACI|nr:Xaa-Pro peptidase family protein [Oceanobacillus jeddahense]UUI01734.1 Xaa-Pro peptidase family protein [Oceanobacillus jeddahense]
MSERINNLFAELKKKQADSCFISSKANVYYLSGYYTDPHERVIGIILMDEIDPIFLLPKMEEEDARNAGWEHLIVSYYDHENPWQVLQAFLKKQEKNPAVMAVEKDHLTVHRYNLLQEILPDTTYIDATDAIQNLRLIKSKKEHEYLRTAADLADLGVKTGVEALKEGVSELEVVATIEHSLKKQGIREMSFQTMALFGAKTASPHGNPDKTQLEKNSFVLFDLGVIYQGYCSDITRTVAFGDITDEQKQIYNTVLTANEKAIEASRAGTAVGELDKIARNYITEQGYGEYFTHRLGHGLGIETHEYPSMHSENTLAIQPGMCFTIEPGIYVPDVGGVRIEDMLFTTNYMPLELTKYPKTLQVIS